MSIVFYQFLHITGVIMIFFALGGVLMHVANGGTREHGFRKIAAITHGIGMAIVFVAGFGLLAKTGTNFPWPLWVYAKLALWLGFGAALFLAYRFASNARLLWWVIPALAALTVYIAKYKPF